MSQPVAELRHERRQLVARDRSGGSGLDVHHVDTRAHRHRSRLVRELPSGVDHHLVATIGQRTGEGRHVDVLPARLAAAEPAVEHRQRAGVLRH
jgi:hypothetical protein